jgi:hypothetical protein
MPAHQLTVARRACRDYLKDAPGQLARGLVIRRFRELVEYHRPAADPGEQAAAGPFSCHGFQVAVHPPDALPGRGQPPLLARSPERLGEEQRRSRRPPAQTRPDLIANARPDRPAPAVRALFGRRDQPVAGAFGGR